MRGVQVACLALVGMARAALPPGYEDELYCPPGACRTHIDGEYPPGPRVKHFHCVDTATGEHVSEPTPWGEMLDASIKENLLNMMWHLEECPVGAFGSNATVTETNVARPRTRCEVEREEALASDFLGVFVPKCEYDGSYAVTQCHENECWCTDPKTGGQSGDRKPAGSFDNAWCVHMRRSLCERQRDEVLQGDDKEAPVPACNPDGSFYPRQCAGDSCWCADTLTGEQVGDTKSTTEVTSNADCPVIERSACVAERDEILAAGLFGACVPQCEADGTYSLTQCQDNRCWCADPNTGKQIGDKKPAADFNDRLCMGLKQSVCEQQRDEAVRSGLLGVKVPACNPDGSFERMQCHEANCWCADPVTGEQIGDVKLGTELTKEDCPAPTRSDCEAERDTAVASGLLGAYAPQCEADGTYSLAQCHEAYCWCAEPNTGKLIGDKKPANTFNDRLCMGLKQSVCEQQRDEAVRSGLLGVKVPACNPDGSFERMQCHEANCWCADPINGEVIGDVKLATELTKEDCPVPTRSTCQTERDTILSSGLLGACVPQCEADGTYSLTQCQDNRCWCADPNTGKQIGDKKPAADFNDRLCMGLKQSVCEQQRDEAVRSGLLGVKVPACNPDGSFERMQCHEANCWCADPVTGEQIGDVKLGTELTKEDCPATFVTVCPADVRSCPDGTYVSRDPKLKCQFPPCKNSTVAERSKCEMERDSAPTGLLGTFIPHCNDDGTYEAKQCHASTGKCWCAHPQTGEKLMELANAADGCDAAAVVEKSKCEMERDSAPKGLLGTFIPHCNDDGTYTQKQCHGSTGKCWCAHPQTGEKLMELASAADGCTEPTPPPLFTECGRVRKEELAKGLLGSRIPQCELDGTYKARQCHASTGMCHCADPYTGLKLSENDEGCKDGVLAGCRAHQAAMATRHPESAFMPKCDSMGGYVTRQHADRGVQWCVDATTGMFVSADPGDCNALCTEARRLALMSNSVDVFVPECRDPSTFRVAQCTRMGACRCVDGVYGEPLPPGADCTVLQGVVVAVRNDSYIVETETGVKVSIRKEGAAAGRPVADQYEVGSSMAVSLGAAGEVLLLSGTSDDNDGSGGSGMGVARWAVFAAGIAMFVVGGLMMVYSKRKASHGVEHVPIPESTVAESEMDVREVTKSSFYNIDDTQDVNEVV